MRIPPAFFVCGWLLLCVAGGRWPNKRLSDEIRRGEGGEGGVDRGNGLSRCLDGVVVCILCCCRSWCLVGCAARLLVLG